MKKILELQDIEQFSGKVVAIDPNEKTQFNLCNQAFQVDNILFGYIQVITGQVAVSMFTNPISTLYNKLYFISANFNIEVREVSPQEILMLLTNLGNKSMRLPGFEEQASTFLSKMINDEKLLIPMSGKAIEFYEADVSLI